MNYENSKVVNFTSLRRILLEDSTPLYVQNPKEIVKNGVVVSELERKEYKFHLK